MTRDDLTTAPNDGRELARGGSHTGRWRRFWQPSTVSSGRRVQVANLPWCDLLNRREALILDIARTRAADRSATVLIALIDTTGAARFAARFAAAGGLLPRVAAAAGGTGAAQAATVHGPTDNLPGSADVLPWSEVHDPLVQTLEGAGVVLAWGAPSKARLLARTARRYGLPTTTVPWRDLRADYRRLGYLNDSLANATRRQAGGGATPGTLASCHRILAVMDACAN